MIFDIKSLEDLSDEEVDLIYTYNELLFNFDNHSYMGILSYAISYRDNRTPYISERELKDFIYMLISKNDFNSFISTVTSDLSLTVTKILDFLDLSEDDYNKFLNKSIDNFLQNIDLNNFSSITNLLSKYFRVSKYNKDQVERVLLIRILNYMYDEEIIGNHNMKEIFNEIPTNFQDLCNMDELKFKFDESYVKQTLIMDFNSYINRGNDIDYYKFRVDYLYNIIKNKDHENRERVLFEKFVFDKLNNDLELSKFKVRVKYMNKNFLELLEIKYGFSQYKRKFILNLLLEN